MAGITPKDDKGEKLGDGTHRYSEGHIFELHADQLGQGLNLNGQTLSGNATLSGNITFSNAVVLSGGIAAGNLALTGNLLVQQTATLECLITIKGGESKNAGLLLAADKWDDAGDAWMIKSYHDTNTLIFQSDVAVKGSFVTKMTLTTGGNFTLVGDIFVKRQDVADALIVATAGLGKDAILHLQADIGNDAADKWSIVSNASGNALTFENNAVSKLTLATNGDLTLVGFGIIPTGKGLTLTGTATGSLGTPANGTIMHDSTTNKLVARLNGAWETITSAA